MVNDTIAGHRSNCIKPMTALTWRGQYFHMKWPRSIRVICKMVSDLSIRCWVLLQALLLVHSCACIERRWLYRWCNFALCLRWAFCQCFSTHRPEVSSLATRIIHWMVTDWHTSQNPLLSVIKSIMQCYYCLLRPPNKFQFPRSIMVTWQHSWSMKTSLPVSDQCLWNSIKIAANTILSGQWPTGHCSQYITTKSAQTY